MMPKYKIIKLAKQLFKVNEHIARCYNPSDPDCKKMHIDRMKVFNLTVNYIADFIPVKYLTDFYTIIYPEGWRRI